MSTYLSSKLLVGSKFTGILTLNCTHFDKKQVTSDVNTEA